MAVRKLRAEENIAFAREFKAARFTAIQDAECFDELLFTVERLGSFSIRKQGDLGAYERSLSLLAVESPLHHEAALKHPAFHLDFHTLYDQVCIARNDALHQGAVARHLARNAQEIALILEDALMTKAKFAAEFMVRDPVCAELWQPLSAIRRTMLLNNFSFLPYGTKDGTWKLISDCNLVAYLRVSESQRKERLLSSLAEALGPGKLENTHPRRCDLNTPIGALASDISEVPCLVISDNNRLCGIITAFDLL